MIKGEKKIDTTTYDLASAVAEVIKEGDAEIVDVIVVVRLVHHEEVDREQIIAVASKMYPSHQVGLLEEAKLYLHAEEEPIDE